MPNYQLKSAEAGPTENIDQGAEDQYGVSTKDIGDLRICGLDSCCYDGSDCADRGEERVLAEPGGGIALICVSDGSVKPAYIRNSQMCPRSEEYQACSPVSI